jgi:hypothetical protein
MRRYLVGCCKDVYERRERERGGGGGERRIKRVFLKEKENKGGIDEACSSWTDGWSICKQLQPRDGLLCRRTNVLRVEY